MAEPKGVDKHARQYNCLVLLAEAKNIVKYPPSIPIEVTDIWKIFGR
jgi:hypothetical protein